MMNKPNIKAIFVDIDWTLYDHKHHCFDYKSIKALKKAQENGVLIILSTARIIHTCNELGIFKEMTPDGGIYSNGIVLLYKNEPIYTHTISKQNCLLVQDAILKYNLNAEFCGPDEKFLIGENLKDVLIQFEYFKEEMPIIKKYTNETITSIELFGTKEFDEALKKDLPKDFHIFRFTDHACDINNVEALKGDGVKRMLEYLKISPDEAMAIGDDDVDISMFDSVKYSVAMGNAPDRIKKHAKYVTYKIHHHGIKHALKHFKII